MGNIKNGKFVYKNEDGMKKMHEFYDKTLASLDVPYAIIERNGKNWYVIIDDSVITVNASSYTIITAHKGKK